MLNQISAFDYSFRQTDIGLKTQGLITDENALDLILDSDCQPLSGIHQSTRADVLKTVRRDATEGSLLVLKMSGPGLHSGLQQQTTLGTGHQVQTGEMTKNLNLNVTADKFLLGTMDALSYTVGSAPPEDPGTYELKTAYADSENTNIESGNSGNTGYNYSYEVLCSPQKKSRTSSRTPRPPLLPPCRVCGDRASGYHYGVNTCEACKGFFRRSICKTEPYVCTGSGDCKTMAGKRTACSHCRFKRCIEVGMSKSAIKTGRYTHELRSKNILEVKRLQKQGSDESPDRTSVDSFNSDTFYTEYKNELLRKSLLEDTLGLLVTGQKMLYEFLDDYYNDDLIRERQLSVYTRYMARKRRLLLQTENLPRHSERLATDSQHLNTSSENLLRHSERVATDSQHVYTSSENLHRQPERVVTDSQHVYTSSENLHRQSERVATDSQHRYTSSENLHRQSERVATDSQHISSPSENFPTHFKGVTTNTQLINTPSECPITNGQHLTSQTEQSTAQTRHLSVQTAQTEHTLHSIPSPAKIELSPDLIASTESIQNEDLTVCAKKLENLTAREQSVVTEAAHDGYRKTVQLNENITSTGKDVTKINTDQSALPLTENIRAEVITKIINDLEQGVQGMLAFAKSLPGFGELSSQDQVSLVKAARFDIWYIGHIRCFNVELRVGACEWQFHAEELAQVWGDSMVDLAFTMSRVAQTLDLTKDETAALRAVCLTFPDRCMDLQRRDDVEQMHTHMLDVFKYVACKRHNDYNKWFPKVIDFLVLLREFGVKFEAVSSKLTLDWGVLKDNPVLLSVFLS